MFTKIPLTLKRVIRSCKMHFPDQSPVSALPYLHGVVGLLGGVGGVFPTAGAGQLSPATFEKTLKRRENLDLIAVISY